MSGGFEGRMRRQTGKDQKWGERRNEKEKGERKEEGDVGYVCSLDDLQRRQLCFQ